jgi:hypothetical protein
MSEAVAERLEDLLLKLEACAGRHLAISREHHKALLQGRRDEVREGVEAMEAVLEEMRELEEVRMDTCQELAEVLGLPWRETPWKLSEILPRVASERARSLRAVGDRLKALLSEGREVAQANASLAEAGHRLVSNSMNALARMAVVRHRAPAAYGRHGTATVRPAVPVLNRGEWRG